MKYACHYAIVRFMPYIETGEFANVGIVLMCPEISYFDFKLLNRVSRITHFFHPLAPRIFKQASKNLDAELTRLQTYLNRNEAMDERSMRLVFTELVRGREVMLRYDAPRTILTNNPKEKLADLFTYYVERDFVTQDYIEKRLESELRSILVAAQVRELYSGTNIKHGPFSTHLPFAHHHADGSVVRAIKPLHLTHDDPAKAYTHGWAWVGKFRQLKHYDALPKDVLIATKSSASNDADHIDIYQDIKSNFEDLGITVIPITDIAGIKQFASDARR